MAAHRAAAEQALGFFERTALFTKTGTAAREQRPTRGVLAAAFDHWDSRAGDPNLHTHVVVAHKGQAPDGRWLAVDSRALHHAVVCVSKVYDDLMADDLASRLPFHGRGGAVANAGRHRCRRAEPRRPGMEAVRLERSG